MATRREKRKIKSSSYVIYLDYVLRTVTPSATIVRKIIRLNGMLQHDRPVANFYVRHNKLNLNDLHGAYGSAEQAITTKIA